MSFQQSLAAPAPRERKFSDDAVQAIFFVTATADPGMVQRLVEPIGKLGLVPMRVHISSEDGNGDELSADLRIAGLTRQTAHLLDKALRRIVGVRQVIALAD